MFKKTFLTILALMFVVTFSACTMTQEKPIDNEPIDNEPIIDETLAIKEVMGLEDVNHPQYAYFNPLKDVKITNQADEDITHYLTVLGQVHYGALGQYALVYTMQYGEQSLHVTRTIDIVAEPITEVPPLNQTGPSETIHQGLGSYITGADPTIVHPVNPQYIAPHLTTRAIPSNGWWTALLVQNYGGGNGLYSHPFRSAFSELGVEITAPGSGFVQYWNPDGYNTMANFSLALPDFHVRSTDLAAAYETTVIDYSDTSVTVAMRNRHSLRDHMVMTYAQGSPYVFAEVANAKAPRIKLAANGVAHYEFYTVSGNRITGSQYEGDGIIIRLVQKHIGYHTARPAQVGQPIYGDRYFLISTPPATTFSFSNEGHPFGLNNLIRLDLNAHNYFSMAPINTLSEGSFYHQHAFNKTLKGDVSYQIDYENSQVITEYQTAYQSFKAVSDVPLLQFLMPHHVQNSDVSFTDYTLPSIHGTLQLFAGSHFTTTLGFHGVLPAMPHPQHEAFSETDMVTYLYDLSSRTAINDPSNFFNDEGPYWNSKALYPLAQGLIIADQIGHEALKNDFIGKLRYLLRDWFTFSGSSDARYLFYNQTWGTVYYSNNDFNTARELSDHSFTHGYLVYAASVLAMYDNTFVAEYGDIVEMLLRDYMHPVKDDAEFAYLRSFDPWVGHTWAHGFGTFAEGNNLESSSEALNAWVGGYLWALATEDQAMIDAAIYGFVHELDHAKTYMFDYSETIFPEKYRQYAQVMGMVWGGKYDYATWFGANPTFIYGIQWLPNGEYLSGYALNDIERARLSDIYQTYLAAKNNHIDTWFANMWSIQALIDPALALQQFSASKILNDDYPSDLSQTYYLIQGLNAYGARSTMHTMTRHNQVAVSIYMNTAGTVHALIWNPSQRAQTVTINTAEGVSMCTIVGARRFTSQRLDAFAPCQ